ncbi:hypothetical protein HII31_00290 [Pseudocercospora fuligena]|uniref:Uncharacterized protein n=1 Tax=Pseudocercospora fuligena TaxID=685502 RepID=A0A8H6RWR6_9PEZI|nr:hypothetical protein HII31_00290 [Pseudocercospora fuligena]
MPCLGLSLRYAVAHLLEFGAKALEEECELPPIKSTYGTYQVDLVREIVANKIKSDGETVSIFEGIFEGKEVIVKCYMPT